MQSLKYPLIKMRWACCICAKTFDDDPEIVSVQLYEVDDKIEELSCIIVRCEFCVPNTDAISVAKSGHDQGETKTEERSRGTYNSE